MAIPSKSLCNQREGPAAGAAASPRKSRTARLGSQDSFVQGFVILNRSGRRLWFPHLAPSQTWNIAISKFISSSGLLATVSLVYRKAMAAWLGSWMFFMSRRKILRGHSSNHCISQWGGPEACRLQGEPLSALRLGDTMVKSSDLARKVAKCGRHIRGFRERDGWAGILAWPLTSHVFLTKMPWLSKPQFPLCNDRLYPYQPRNDNTHFLDLFARTHNVTYSKCSINGTQSSELRLGCPACLLVIALWAPEELKMCELPNVFCFVSIDHWSKTFQISHPFLFITSLVREGTYTPILMLFLGFLRGEDRR